MFGEENWWKFGDDFELSFFFLATTAGRPIGRLDFAIDCSRPRSNATSRSALIQTRSDSGRPRLCFVEIRHTLSVGTEWGQSFQHADTYTIAWPIDFNEKTHLAQSEDEIAKICYPCSDSRQLGSRSYNNYRSELYMAKTIGDI